LFRRKEIVAVEIKVERTFNSTVTNNIVGCIVYKTMVLVPAAVEVLVFEIVKELPPVFNPLITLSAPLKLSKEATLPDIVLVAPHHWRNG
jgi:hypothetical protein